MALRFRAESMQFSFSIDIMSRDGMKSPSLFLNMSVGSGVYCTTREGDT